MHKLIQVTYIVFSIDKALEFEWVAERLDQTKFELTFISINTKADTALAEFCKEREIAFKPVFYQSKKDLPYAIWKVYKILKKEKPDLINAHLFEGGLIGITAARLAGIKHRIYTRHYSNYHHKYAPSGLKYDRWINKNATHIISITQLVSDILIEKENVPQEKITLIYHGFPFEQFRSISQERIVAVKRRHGLPLGKTIIGVISRYTFWKGVQDILPAFKQLCASNPDVYLVLANAKGDYQAEINKLLESLPKGSYTEILFEEDNAALFKAFDIFVHVPVDEESEAFGQIYIEALLCGIPSIFTKSGIGSEVAKNGQNCLVVPYQDSVAILQALESLVEHDELRLELSKNAVESVNDFTIEKKVKKLEQLYMNLICH